MNQNVKYGLFFLGGVALGALGAVAVTRGKLDVKPLATSLLSSGMDLREKALDLAPAVALSAPERGLGRQVGHHRGHVAPRHAPPAIVPGPRPFSGPPPGQVTSAMHRLFYTGAVDWSGKVGAAVVNSRRGGETTAFDQLNKYFTISGMPIVSSYYWNELYGNAPEEAAQDAEGLAVMRQLGRNMAWLIACIKDGAEAGHPYPGRVHRAQTNFIR